MLPVGSKSVHALHIHHVCCADVQHQKVLDLADEQLGWLDGWVSYRDCYNTHACQHAVHEHTVRCWYLAHVGAQSTVVRVPFHSRGGLHASAAPHLRG